MNDTENNDESVFMEGVNNMRPSYQIFEDSYLGPQSADFNAGVARKLSAELLLADDDHGGKIRTYLRIRPHSKKLKTTESSQIYKIETSNILKIDGSQFPKRNNPYADATRFTFSKILGPECSQSTVFEECVQPMLEAFFRGESCLIFSYGATNSGKTYTMQGYGTSFGIVPRTLDHIFNFLEDKMYTHGDIKPNLFNAFVSLSPSDAIHCDEVKVKVMKEVKGKSSEMSTFRDSFARSSATFSTCSTLDDKVVNIRSIPSCNSAHSAHSTGADLYAVWVSFAEIYNERVFDLFDTVTTTNRGRRRKELKLQTDKNGRVYIKDLTELCANSAEEAYQLFLAGKANLQFAATRVNNNSSRSHSFFNIRMVSVGVTESAYYPKKVFQMSFCDLAGIERVSQTQNVGMRLKESGSINQSLFVLLKCIRAMRDKQTKNSCRVELAPFRESKLARLFQGFLTSATHTCMIVNVNPDPEMVDSSLQVLQNSAIASEVITYRRVEPPKMNDSNYHKRVRASIGMANDLKLELAHSNGVPAKKGRFEEESDDEFCEATVVAKCKIPGATNKISELEAGNELLKQRLLTIQEETRAEVSEKFRTLIEQQNDYYKSIVQCTESTCEQVYDRRISFIAKVLDSDNGEIFQNLTSAASVKGDDDSLSSHSDANSFKTPDNKKQSTINNQLELKKAIEFNQKLLNDNDDLQSLNRALQCSLDERHMALAKLQVEMKEKEEATKEQIANMNKMLQLNAEQIEKFQQNDPSQVKTEALQQVSNLTKELEIQNQVNATLRTELTEATSLIVEYDSKLAEANKKIQEVTTTFNELHSRNQELTEENELTHLSVDDYMGKLEEANKEIQQLKCDVEQLKASQVEDSQERKHKSSRRRLN